MSVNDQISRISSNIAASYAAVQEKGGTLPSSRNSQNLAAAIRSISSGSTPVVAAPGTAYDSFKRTVLTGKRTAGTFTDFTPDIIIADLSNAGSADNASADSGILFDDGYSRWTPIYDEASGQVKYLLSTINNNTTRYSFHDWNTDTEVSMSSNTDVQMIHLPLVQDFSGNSNIGCQSTYDTLTASATLVSGAPYEKTSTSQADKYYLTGIQAGATIRNRWIRGSNAYKYFSAVGSIATIPGTNTNNAWGAYVGVNNVTFENCVFESCKGINAVNCSGLTIRNCIFKDSASPIHLKGVSNVTIDHCTIDINNTGLYIISAIYVGTDCSNINITNTSVFSAGSCGKAFRFGNDGSQYVNTVSATINNCYVSGSFSSVIFAIGHASVTASNIKADLCRSWLSSEPNKSGTTYDPIYRCDDTSTLSLTDVTTNMDYDRVLKNTKVTETRHSHPIVSPLQRIVGTSSSGSSGGSGGDVVYQDKTVTPSASTQTVTADSGNTLRTVTVSGDSDLIASNIKSGVNIFGVTGTLNPGSGGLSNDTGWKYTDVFAADQYDPTGGIVTLKDGFVPDLILISGGSYTESDGSTLNVTAALMNIPAFGTNKWADTTMWTSSLFANNILDWNTYKDLWSVDFYASYYGTDVYLSCSGYNGDNNQDYPVIGARFQYRAIKF